MDKINPKPKPEKREKKKPRGITKKKTSRKSMYDKIHAIMRQIVIDRDGGCVCPPPEKGHSIILQAGHIITKRKGSVRFDLKNVHCQCSSCNGRHEDFPMYFIDWFSCKFGQEELHQLNLRSDRVEEMKMYELEELLLQMKKIREKQLVSALSGEPFKPYFSQKDILSGAWNNVA
jgi:hypothetical protein